MKRAVSFILTAMILIMPMSYSIADEPTSEKTALSFDELSELVV